MVDTSTAKRFRSMADQDGVAHAGMVNPTWVASSPQPLEPTIRCHWLIDLGWHRGQSRPAGEVGAFRDLRC